jgi:glycosyltransferase involved in cell wall biosynthesis
MMPQGSGMRVWMNVTTSAGWNRPAVGIVRVERALAEHLQDQFGPERCKLCVWSDGRFVEWAPMAGDVPGRVARAVDTLVPRGPSFDLVRTFVTRALARFYQDDRNDGGATDELRVALPLSGAAPLHPAPGDFLISAGLDWEHPYTRQFHELTKKQGLRIITCCYDLIPVLFPQYCVGDVAQRFTEYFLELSWGSEAVLCISEQTRRDYVRLCDELGAPVRRTLVIPLGDNLPSGNSAISEQVRSACQSPFILYVSTIERRKNHEVLYRAYHILQRRGPSTAALPKIIFVGMQGWGIGDLMKDIELDPLTRGLILQLNQVSDAELEYLYEHAFFCVFPSLYEGWGLPVGEALAMGKAVIAYGEGSLPEVGGELVRYVAPWNAYAWADAIREYVENPELVREAERRVRAGYDPRKWSDTAKTVTDLIADLSTADDRDCFDLLPGYELSTLCGMHCGPSIRSTGMPGLLVFGPHRALRQGHYDVQVQGSWIAGFAGGVLIEVASHAGIVVHFSQRFERPAAAESGLSIDLSFSLAHEIRDFEIKCSVSASTGARIDRVIVKRRGSGSASPAGGKSAAGSAPFVGAETSQPAAG